MNQSTLALDLTEKSGSNVLKTDTKSYVITEQYKNWEKLFLDEKNPATFGNQTRSAIIAYNLDEKTQYGTAARMGSDNCKKHKDIMAKYFAKKGVTYGKLLEIYFNKMMKSPTPDLLYSLAGAIDAPLPEYKNVTNPKVNATNNILVQGDMSVKFTRTEE